MRVASPSTAEIVIMVWFVASVLITVIGTFGFWIWLLRRGVKLLFMWVGTPGYLEYAYLKWCRNQGCPPNKFLVSFRAISVINVIIAAAFFIVNVLR